MQPFDTDSNNTTQTSGNTETFIVCADKDIPPGTCRRLALRNGTEVAIYNVDGEYYAIDNFCPHRGAPLCEGALFGHVVECSWHGWQFDVRTGECLTVMERIKVFDVNVIDDVVCVEVDVGR